MECVLQWLDEIDDAVSMIAAQSETIQRVMHRLLAGCAGFLVLAAGAALALLQPLAAPLVVSLLLALLLFHRLQAAGRSELHSARRAPARTRSH